MTMFTWALDLCVVNAYGLLRCLKGADPPGMTLREFKRRIVEALTAQERARRQKKRPVETPIAAAQSTAHAIASDTSNHYITTNQNGRVLECRLCREVGWKIKVCWGCTGCNEGFMLTALLHTTRGTRWTPIIPRWPMFWTFWRKRQWANQSTRQGCDRITRSHRCRSSSYRVTSDLTVHEVHPPNSRRSLCQYIRGNVHSLAVFSHTLILVPGHVTPIVVAAVIATTAPPTSAPHRQ
ncbi:hypothetical protein PR002_g22552 [Phytophthora rubi]|uniref:PiggyBac transposable element-derived protein domain-containing protein n=1 Tax=Phytophthora rubi TaxID=129364 RepID=A0A6A3J2W8_9STRA|nr:hypothetical protein PR002_g22552 [Phytophthora rubi]